MTVSGMPAARADNLPERMKAMVFAAGLGTRMRPLTDTLPKPLVEIGGKAMIDTLLDALADAGVSEAVVNVHHLADQIEARMRDRKNPQITISNERDLLLDQGGGLKKALPRLGKHPFFICNTDAIWIEGPLPNLQRLRAQWDPEKMDILLMVAATTSAVGVDWGGDFRMEGDGRLVRRREGEVVPFAYSGIGIIKPELIAAVEKDVFRLAPLFFEAAEKRRLYGMRLDGHWLHVGTMDAIAQAEALILNVRK